MRDRKKNHKPNPIKIALTTTSQYNRAMQTELSQDFFNMTGTLLTAQQSAAFEIYARELRDWNNHYSLTAIRNSDKVRVKHYLDSLSACLVMRNTAIESIVDVGTGAGFPGLPLKILWPHLHLTLMTA